MSQFRIKPKSSKKTRQAAIEQELADSMVMVDGQPRIPLSALARVMGISYDEAQQLMLTHISELAKIAPVICTRVDDTGEVKVRRIEPQSEKVQ